MGDPRLLAILEELNDIVAADGAALRVAEVSPSALALELDLTESECPECVVPRDFIVQIVATRLAETGVEVPEITLFDPREEPGWELVGH